MVVSLDSSPVVHYRFRQVSVINRAGSWQVENSCYNRQEIKVQVLDRDDDTHDEAKDGSKLEQSDVSLEHHAM